MLGNGCILLDDDVEVVYRQDISHPGGNMPATVMFWFWVDPDGIHFFTGSNSRAIQAIKYFFFHGFSALLRLTPLPWPDATARVSLATPALERSINLYLTPKKSEKIVQNPTTDLMCAIIEGRHR